MPLQGMHGARHAAGPPPDTPSGRPGAGRLRPTGCSYPFWRRMISCHQRDHEKTHHNPPRTSKSSARFRAGDTVACEVRALFAPTHTGAPLERRADVLAELFASDTALDFFTGSGGAAHPSGDRRSWHPRAPGRPLDGPAGSPCEPAARGGARRSVSSLVLRQRGGKEGRRR